MTAVLDLTDDAGNTAAYFYGRCGTLSYGSVRW